MKLDAIVGKFQTLRHAYSGDMLLAIATMTTPAVGFIANFVGARHVEPESMGIYQTLMLVSAYAGFLQLGVFNGAGRNIPFFHGRGDHGKVQLVVNATAHFARLVSLVNITLCAGILLYLLWAGFPRIYLWTMGCIAFAMATDPFYTQLDGVYRGIQHYRDLGRRTLVLNLAGFFCSLLPVIAGYWGYLAGRVGQALVRIPILRSGVPLKPIAPGKFSEISDLGRTGFPLLIAGVLYGYLGVADRSVTAALLGPVAVGHLTLSSLVVASVQFAPVALTTVLYPRIAAHYGRCGSSRGLRRYFWITLGLSVVTVIPVCLLAYLLIEPATRMFLPKYIDGIAAAKVAALGSMGFLYFGVGAIIAVVRKNTPYIAAIVVALGIAWLLGFSLIGQGWGILGAAWARAVATAFLCLFTVGYAYWLTTRDIRC